MKNLYLILFPLIILVILSALYFVNIPSPSKKITEDYNLVIK